MNPEQGRVLLQVARQAVGAALGDGVGPRHREPWLQEPAAVFVTVRLGTSLVGCIGTTEATRPLLSAVERFALLAAFEDPRTPTLSREDFEASRFQISVLSPMSPLPAHSEEEVISALSPGQDGVAIACAEQRGLFLPQVWSSLPEPLSFLAALKRKAGLPPHGWPRGMSAWRFSVQAFAEPGYAEPDETAQP